MWKVTPRTSAPAHRSGDTDRHAVGPVRRPLEPNASAPELLAEAVL
jgi:hypothetical protein